MDVIVAVFESNTKTIKRLFILNSFFVCCFYDLKIIEFFFIAIACGAKIILENEMYDFKV